jgi:hypothetical protein
MKTNTYAVPEGCKITSVDFEKGVVVYEINQPKYKVGDFVYGKNLQKSEWVGIFNGGAANTFNYFYRICNGYLASKGISIIEIQRLATPEEKALLISKMRENGKDWDEEKCEVVDYVEMIEVGQDVYFLDYAKPFEGFTVANYRAYSKIPYKKDEFKIKQLAQTACDELNKVLKTLKHY